MSIELSMDSMTYKCWCILNDCLVEFVHNCCGSSGRRWVLIWRFGFDMLETKADGMKLKLALTAFFWIVAGSNLAYAAEASKWRGYLLDKMCADSVVEDSNPTSFIQHHTKDCALMRNCKAAGYGLYVKGKWFDLDKQGNQQAIKVLQASKKNSGFYVEIAGGLHGKVLQVQSIKEVEEPKAQSEEHAEQP